MAGLLVLSVCIGTWWLVLSRVLVGVVMEWQVGLSIDPLFCHVGL